jgi:hypothetical protein
MRFLLLVILNCCLAENALAQCPVLPSHISIDSHNKDISIRYYNSGVRVVQAVEFTLQRPQAEQKDSAVLSRYSAVGTLHPKAEKTAVFRCPARKSDGISEAAQVEDLELQVTRVVFTDQSTWKPGRADTCKVSFSPR